MLTKFFTTKLSAMPNRLSFFHAINLKGLETYVNQLIALVHGSSTDGARIFHLAFVKIPWRSHPQASQLRRRPLRDQPAQPRSKRLAELEIQFSQHRLFATGRYKFLSGHHNAITQIKVVTALEQAMASLFGNVDSPPNDTFCRKMYCCFLESKPICVHSKV